MGYRDFPIHPQPGFFELIIKETGFNPTRLTTVKQEQDKRRIQSANWLKNFYKLEEALSTGNKALVERALSRLHGESRRPKMSPPPPSPPQPPLVKN